MKKIIITIIALLAIFTQAVGSASAQGEELIVDGGFETPVVDSSVAIWNVYPSGTPGLGWQVEWYGGATDFGGFVRPAVPFIEFHRPGALWPVYEGSQYAELDTDWFGPSSNVDGEPASIRISQDVSTCIGGVYELKYAWSPRPNKPDNAMEVSWGATNVATHTGAGAALTVWTPETWSLTATTTTTRLSFVETGTPDGVGMFLDGVSLIQTNACPVSPKIDIKPGKYPNKIYLSSAKYIQVAVLGSANFNIYQIDIPTLVFAGLHIRQVNGLNKCWAADVSGNFTHPAGAPDGYLDLNCLFVFDAHTFSPNADGTATLSGKLVNGTSFLGTDTLTVLP